MKNELEMSIDTIQINSHKVPAQNTIAIHDNPKHNIYTGLYSYVFNINNLNTDKKQITDFSTYAKLKDNEISKTELIDANTVRIDFAYDSTLPNFYSDMYVITKYLIMLIANKYVCRNTYETRNLWTLNENSIVLKSQYFDIEYYNKAIQENKSENEQNITARLEFRMKKQKNNNKIVEQAKEITAFEHLKTILKKAISKDNIEDLNDKITDSLLQKIVDERSDTITVTEILNSYRTNIYNYDILFDVLLAIGYIDYKQKGYRFVKQKGLKMYKRKDLKMYVDSLINIGENYFSK